MVVCSFLYMLSYVKACALDEKASCMQARGREQVGHCPSDTCTTSTAQLMRHSHSLTHANVREACVFCDSIECTRTLLCCAYLHVSVHGIRGQTHRQKRGQLPNVHVLRELHVPLAVVCVRYAENAIAHKYLCAYACSSWHICMHARCCVCACMLAIVCMHACPILCVCMLAITYMYCYLDCQNVCVPRAGTNT